MKDRLLRRLARAALQDPLVGVLGRRRQRGNDEGLDPQVAAVVELQRLMRLPALDSMAPPRARRFAESGLSPLDVDTAPMAEVIDTSVTGRGDPIAVRIFVPFDAGPNWIVYFHGGGGVIGSIRASEPVTRLLAAQTKCTVASVEYRLGPEYPHPAGIDDSSDAYAALVTRVAGAGKVAVAGDSFGGFLAANVDREARERGLRQPDLQVLIYPTTDLLHPSPAINRLASGYLLTKSMIEWFADHYHRPHDDRRFHSPMHWADISGVAPAIVVTAGFDPLVEEGDDYAARLSAAGVTLRHRRHPSLIHGFLSLAGGVRAARAATDQICDDIVELLASS